MWLVRSIFFKPSSLIFPSIQQERRNKPHFLCTDRRNERRDGSHQMDFERATKHLLRVVPTLQYDICIVMLYQYVRRSVFLGVSCLARQLPTQRLTFLKGFCLYMCKQQLILWGLQSNLCRFKHWKTWMTYSSTGKLLKWLVVLPGISAQHCE